jgi:hypothetical protein
MDIGTVSATTFDIDSLGETDAVLVRGNGVTKFIWKNENNEAVMLQKNVETSNVSRAGSLLKISDVDGYAKPVLDKNLTATVCGKLVADIDWDDISNFHSATFVADGVERVAVLAPVVLY